MDVGIGSSENLGQSSIFESVSNADARYKDGVSRYRAAISHNVEGILYLASETKDCILYLARFATNQTLRIVEIRATGLGHNGIVFGRWKRVS